MRTPAFLSVFLLPSAGLAACAPSEPPRWAEGGAPLVLPAARWNRGDDDLIEIRADGQVYEDGDLLFVIDRAGRVVDDEYEPVAILFPDGRLVGTDRFALGHIGMSNASPPDRSVAWLAVLPDGKVIYFDEDGERSSGGSWIGCAPPGLRSCTLVTHLIALRNYVRRSSGVSVGIGVGVGF